jgi:hypothetical protein
MQLKPESLKKKLNRRFGEFHLRKRLLRHGFWTVVSNRASLERWMAPVQRGLFLHNALLAPRPLAFWPLESMRDPNGRARRATARATWPKAIKPSV